MKPETKKELISFVIEVAVVMVAVFGITRFIARPIQVNGSSMVPTLKNGDYGIANVIKVKMNNIERGDVVVIDVGDEYIIKRVIGMPNETISCKDGLIYIDGELIADPVTDKGSSTEDFAEVKIGEDEYFCLGDNRAHSKDSRYYGAFSSDEIKCAGVFILWPWEDKGPR